VNNRKRVQRFPSSVPRCCAWRNQDCHVCEQRVRVSVFCLFLTQCLNVFARLGAIRLIRGCCTSHHPPPCDRLLMSEYALGSTRITDWRLPSPSKTRTFPKMEPRARFCLRKHLGALLWSRYEICPRRIGASPRLCFEKYVDVSCMAS
jgi:hypothetical protein